VIETFQALPQDGYTAMFEKILRHPRINVRINTDYRQLPPTVKYERMIYTGMIDEFYNFSEGRLPYRSMRFEAETLPQEFFQPSMQVNYPNDHEYTRVVEIKHATGQKSPVTTIVREYPEDFGPGKEAYYPVPAPDSKELYEKYAAKAKMEKNVTFVGRLATYRYYNMDQVVAMALTEFDKLKASKATN
jgi:UDP-galactopyranose mutase